MNSLILGFVGKARGGAPGLFFSYFFLNYSLQLRHSVDNLDRILL